jgi:hypothetical protein
VVFERLRRRSEGKGTPGALCVMDVNVQEPFDAIRIGALLLDAGPERAKVAPSRLILDFDLFSRDKELFKHRCISAVSRPATGGLSELSFRLRWWYLEYSWPCRLAAKYAAEC